MKKQNKRRGAPSYELEMKTLHAREREFQGKNVIVIGSEIFAIEDDQQAVQLLTELREKYPDQTPLLAYAMGEETYILWL